MPVEKRPTAIGVGLATLLIIMMCIASGMTGIVEQHIVSTIVVSLLFGSESGGYVIAMILILIRTG